jgi:hypothetical protein
LSHERRLARHGIPERPFVVEVERFEAVDDVPKDSRAVFVGKTLEDAEQRGYDCRRHAGVPQLAEQVVEFQPDPLLGRNASISLRISWTGRVTMAHPIPDERRVDRPDPSPG